MAKKKVVNWNKIKTEYITTDISQRKLAEKYKVAYPTLRDRCKMENWYQSKKEYRSKVVTKAVEQSCEKEAAVLACELQVTDKLVRLLQDTLTDDTYKARTVYGDEIINAKDTKKILEAANALTKLTEIKRIIKGHQTVKEKQAHDIALRKMELEEQKVKQEKNTDRKIVVELPDEMKDWVV